MGPIPNIKKKKNIVMKTIIKNLLILYLIKFIINENINDMI